MAFVFGGEPCSFKGVGKSFEEYKREAAAGNIKLRGATKLTPDEQALLFYMSNMEYGASRYDALKEMEVTYGLKFDEKSLLARLEVFYEKALRGEVVVEYGHGIDSLRRSMDALCERVNK